MFRRLRLLSGALLLTALVVGCADEGAVESTGSAANADTSPQTAVSDLQKASDAKAATDTRLGNALGRVGGMLTQTQSSAFAQVFNALPDVVAAETDYQTKAQTLADSLAAVAADPAQITSFGPKNLVAGYALLAKTPQAPAALDFGTNVLEHKIVLDGYTDQNVLDQIVGPSLAGAYMQNLLQTGSVTSATAATVAVLSKGSSISLTIAGWIQRYNAFQQVDVIDDLLGISSDSTLAGLRTIAGVIAIWTVGDDLFDGDPHAALTAFLNSGGNAVNGIAAATSLFRSIIVGVDKTPLADTVIKWSGKIATGIGLVMNAIALWNDAGKWNDSAAAKVQVASDVIALAASIACLTLTGPVGPILATVSLGLGFFTAWLQNRTIAAQTSADVQACLPLIGLDPTLAQTIMNADAGLVGDLATNVGLAPDQLQWLITVDPSLVSADSSGSLTFGGLANLKSIFALDAPGVTALLQATAGADTDATQRVDIFVRGLDFGTGTGFGSDLSTADALTWLQNEETDPSATDATEQTAAFTAAHDYLAALQ